VYLVTRPYVLSAFPPQRVARCAASAPPDESLLRRTIRQVAQERPRLSIRGSGAGNPAKWLEQRSQSGVDGRVRQDVAKCPARLRVRRHGACPERRQLESGVVTKRRGGGLESGRQCFAKVRVALRARRLQSPYDSPDDLSIARIVACRGGKD